MTRGALVLLLAGLALAAPASGHWLQPEEIVTELNARAVRDALGVSSARRDDKTPRLLVVRVGPRWYELTTAVRRLQARDWADLWRHNVPEGIIAILDDRSARPVVKFDATGGVASVEEHPPGS